MADVTPILINGLASQSTLSDSDYFIVGGADAKKISVAEMKEALGINALNGKLYYINAIDSDGSIFHKDFCSVNLTFANSPENQNCYFAKPVSSDGWLNVPPDLSNSEWIGIRNVYRRTNFHVLVEIIEMYPIRGRIWTNFYNDGSWTGWNNSNQLFTQNIWKGQLAYDDSQFSFPATIFCRKYINGIMDIHISTKCESKYTEANNISDIWSYSQLCSACGISGLSFSQTQTQAYVYNANDNQIPIEDHLGRTGLLVEANQISLKLARVYNDNMDVGGWGTETTLYSQGTYYQLHIYGAVYY